MEKIAFLNSSKANGSRVSATVKRPWILPRNRGEAGLRRACHPSGRFLARAAALQPPVLARSRRTDWRRKGPFLGVNRTKSLPARIDEIDPEQTFWARGYRATQAGYLRF